eukprot:476803-Hanusia_phi.AAC.1
MRAKVASLSLLADIPSLAQRLSWTRIEHGFMFKTILRAFLQGSFHPPDVTSESSLTTAVGTALPRTVRGYTSRPAVFYASDPRHGSSRHGFSAQPVSQAGPAAAASLDRLSLP